MIFECKCCMSVVPVVVQCEHESTVVDVIAVYVDVSAERCCLQGKFTQMLKCNSELTH